MRNSVMPPSLIRRGRHVWLNPRLWFRRIVLWIGAVLVGIVAIAFAISAEYANSLHQKMVDFSFLFPFDYLVNFRAVKYSPFSSIDISLKS